MLSCGPPEDLSVSCFREVAVQECGNAVHDGVANPLREPVRVIERALVGDGAGVEHGDIGGGPLDGARPRSRGEAGLGGGMEGGGR